MNQVYPVSDAFWYRRLRLFLELSVGDVALATGLAAARIAQLEQGRGKTPADFETRVLRGFFHRWVMQTIPDAPAWLNERTPELSCK